MNNDEKEQISEQDLEYIFAGKKPRRRRYVVTVFKYLLLSLLIFVILFVAINYQAIIHKIKYWYKSDLKNEQSSTETNTSTFEQNNQAPALPQISENHVVIPKISVDAPVTWEVNNNNRDVSHGLENGAIHLYGSALPGTVGNVFITAHSSNYAWAPGNYKTLFSLLDKLVVGDNIYLKYQAKTYTYTVNKIYTTDPNDLSVLEQDKNSILTLMTCTPVGTSLNRLIVVSNQAYPNPIKNTPSKYDNSNTSLPSVR